MIYKYPVGSLYFSYDKLSVTDFSTLRRGIKNFFYLYGRQHLVCITVVHNKRVIVISSNYHTLSMALSTFFNDKTFSLLYDSTTNRSLQFIGLLTKGVFFSTPSLFKLFAPNLIDVKTAPTYLLRANSVFWEFSSNNISQMVALLLDPYTSNLNTILMLIIDSKIQIFRRLTYPNKNFL